MNGQSRQKDFPLKPFGDAVTLSLYLDTNFAYSANHPRDNTFTGTASVPRHNEFNVNLASVGLEWNYKNIIGRLSLRYGSMISIVQDLVVRLEGCGQHQQSRRVRDGRGRCDRRESARPGKRAHGRQRARESRLVPERPPRARDPSRGLLQSVALPLSVPAARLRDRAPGEGAADLGAHRVRPT